jgi:hypothetical protein
MTVDEIRQLGFEWPKYPIIEEYCFAEENVVDLGGTLEKMRSSRDFYKKQINDAYRFKMQTGADYSDFTNKFDDYVRSERQLRVAIAYLEVIMEAASQDLEA